MAKSSKGQSAPEDRVRRKEQAAERKERQQAEFKADLDQKLEVAKSTALDLEEKSKAARENATIYKALVSHLEGFYQEIDKLSKNKGVFGATDLVVETINDIVRDAKRFATVRNSYALRRPWRRVDRGVRTDLRRNSNLGNRLRLAVRRPTNLSRWHPVCSNAERGCRTPAVT